MHTGNDSGPPEHCPPPTLSGGDEPMSNDKLSATLHPLRPAEHECPECGNTHTSRLAALYEHEAIEADDRAARRIPPRDTRRERYYLSED